MTEADNPVPEAPNWEEIYSQLRSIAVRFLSRERPDHTLQPTALVHEVYLRYSRDRRFADADRAKIMSCAARTMRDVLVEHARCKRALKRGGAGRRVALDETLVAYEERAVDLIELDQALQRLQLVDDQLARIVELRFFGGLTEEDTAIVLGVSARTVRRGWRTAKLWLARELEQEQGRGNTGLDRNSPHS